MIVISHPTGNSNVRAAIRAFFDRGILERFFTTIAWRPNQALAQLIPERILRELERRAYHEAPDRLISSRPRKELLRHLAEKAKFSILFNTEAAPFSVDSIYQDLDQYVATQLPRLKRVDTVYSYEDGALATFERAELLGVRRVYDLPIGYWRASRELAEREAQESPEWASSLSALYDSERKHHRKDRELSLADRIIVASQFTKNSLKLFPGFDEDKVVVVPYGAPHPASIRRVQTDRDKPLRVLYVGALSQRKGISYLGKAMDLVGRIAVLTLVGRPTFPIPEPVKRMCEMHRWIPSLPHSELLAEMSRHDVLVFPSLFEGFGLVITEAISQGLPVITTANTGGPDVLTHGVDGFIVPIRSPDAIAQYLFLLADNREILEQMSQSALARANELTWVQYEQKLVEAVQ